MTIVLVAIGTGGTLGHATSASALAVYLEASLQDTSVVVAADAQLCEHLQRGVKSRSLRTENKHLGSRGGALRSNHYFEQLVDLDRSLKPQAYVFDTFFDRMFLERLSNLGTPRVLLSYRYRDTMLELFDYDHRSLFDKCFWLREPPDLVTGRDDQIGSSNVTTIYPLEVPRHVSTIDAANPKTIVVTCGGGGRPGAMDLLRVVRRAAACLEGYHLCLFAGPFGKLRGAANGTVSRRAFLSLMATADLVVSEAGYFTCLEALCLARRVLLVPGAREIDNQELRALRMSQLSGFSLLFRDELEQSLTPSLLHDLIRSSNLIERLPEWTPDPTIAEYFSSVVGVALTRSRPC